MASAFAFQSEITSARADGANVVNRTSVGKAAPDQVLQFDMAVSLPKALRRDCRGSAYARGNGSDSRLWQS